MQKAKWIKHAPAIAIAIVVVLAIAAVLLLKDFFQGDDARPKKMIQQITMITPPPPPPPPPQEPIKQPEVEEEQIKEAETPQEQPQEQPAESESVQQDPNASGEGPLIAAGTGRGMGVGSGGGGAYEQYVRHEINDWVVENPRLKRLDYVAMLTLQIGAEGEIESCDVEIVSGDAEARDILKKLFNDKRKFSRARPLEAASLVKLRIKSVL